MKHNLRDHIISFVEEGIMEMTLEKKAIATSMMINLEYAVDNGSLDRIYFYDIMIKALTLLPDYIKSDKSGSFAGFLKKEIEYLTQSLLCSSFTNSTRSHLVKLDTKSSLAESYHNILQEMILFKHKNKTK